MMLASDLTQLLHGTQQSRFDAHWFAASNENFAQNASVVMHWHERTLTLQPVTAEMYSGTLEGEAHAKNFSQEPNWEWNVRFNQVQIKPLLTDVNGADGKLNISGTGNVKIIASTSGSTREQIFSHLKGVAEFSLTDGVVEGMDLNFLVQTADDLISGHPIAMPQNLNQTAFQSLTGTANISNGVAHVDNLLLNSLAFTTKGKGWIDLARSRLEYQLDVTPVHPGKYNWTIPVLVAGDVRSPSVKVDKSALETIIASEQFQKVKSKVQEEIKKLPEQANKFMQNLLGH